MPEVPLTPKADPKEKRILIVEDDDQIRELIRAALQAEGFQAQTLRDGRNILEKAVPFKPDLVVSDIMMPGGGGYEVLRALQSEEATRGKPVIIITGYSFDQSTKDMMRAEPNVAAFIEKPIRPQMLLERIHTLLHTKSKSEKMIEEQGQGSGDIRMKGFDDPF